MFSEFSKKFHISLKGKKLLLAVSGGRDSMYLLSHALEESAAAGFSLCCAHYNHGLRGAASDADQAFVENFCESRDIPLQTGRGDAARFARQNGMSIEEAARYLRYTFLEAAALAAGADYIATAHNAQDNAETMLLNLARGAGLRGLCGIPPLRESRVIRPMLDIPRPAIDAYMREKNLAFVEDETNRSPDYARNRLRSDCLPTLLTVNPAFVENAARTAELLRRDEDFLGDLAEEFLGKHLFENSLPANALADLPLPISARVLRLALGPSLTQTHIEAVLSLCGENRASGFADLPGRRVTREYDRLSFGPGQEGCLVETEVLPGPWTEISGTGLLYRCEIAPFSPEIHSSFNTFGFQCTSICGKIVLGSRRAGDFIRLRGRNCTKSLKKLMAETKLPRSLRDRTPVLRDEEGLLAVYGFGADERGAPRTGDAAYIIEIKEKNGGTGI